MVKTVLPFTVLLVHWLLMFCAFFSSTFTFNYLDLAIESTEFSAVKDRMVGSVQNIN